MPRCFMHPPTRRSRRALPQVEMLEPKIALSTAVTMAATQVEAALPVINVAVSALATGQAAKARNVVVITEHIFFGAQSQQVILVGAAQTSPGGMATVDATANQVELAAPVVDVVANATASGKHALALNIIHVDINLFFGDQTQTVVLGPGGTSAMSTVTVTATADQVLVAAPEVDLLEQATASGWHAVSVNRITVTMNVFMGDQTASTSVTGAGVSLAGLVTVTSTATQATINDPTENISEAAQATGPGATAQNKIRVTEHVKFASQKARILMLPKNNIGGLVNTPTAW